MTGEEKVALVTGARGGIGIATVEALSEAGYRVVGSDRSSSRGTRATQRYVRADLENPAEIDELVRGIADREGRLDVLVNNAATHIKKNLTDLSEEEWDRLISVNLRAPLLLARHSLGLLEDSRGSVVNIASVHAVATSAGMSAYAASKGGLVALGRALAVELADRGIRVNTLLPGAVDTPMLSAGFRAAPVSVRETRRELIERTPLQRIGTPQDIAEAVIFLADPLRSGFMTGASLVVDGGALARLSTE